MKGDATCVHSVSTLAHEQELDSEDEDCVDAVGESDVIAVISEVVRKMDEVEEECSESGLIYVDSVYASESE